MRKPSVERAESGVVHHLLPSASSALHPPSSPPQSKSQVTPTATAGTDVRSNNMEYTLAKPTADEYHAVSALKGAAFAEKNFCFGMCCGEEGIKLRTEAFTKWESSNPAKLDHLRVVRGGDGEILGACQLQIGDDPGDAELESVGTSTDRFERQPFNIQHSISFFYFSHFLPSFVRTSDQHVTKYVRLFSDDGIYATVR